jgi:hypothetical protein
VSESVAATVTRRAAAAAEMSWRRCQARAGLGLSRRRSPGQVAVAAQTDVTVATDIMITDHDFLGRRRTGRRLIESLLYSDTDISLLG